jgi:hypothetical protein
MAAAASGRLPDPLAAFSFPGSPVDRDATRDTPYIEGDRPRDGLLAQFHVGEP